MGVCLGMKAGGVSRLSARTHGPLVLPGTAWIMTACGIDTSDDDVNFLPGETPSALRTGHVAKGSVSSVA